MKSKWFKRLVLVVALVLMVFVLSACAPVAEVAHLLQVPVELVALIQVGVGIAVTWIITQLLKLGLDFSGYKVQVTAAIVAAVVVVLNALLAKIPPSLEALAGGLLNLLVIILGSFGLAQIVHQVKMARAKAKG